MNWTVISPLPEPLLSGGTFAAFEFFGVLGAAVADGPT